MGSIGAVEDALDNAVAESFLTTLQVKLLDRRYWQTRQQLTTAIFDYIEVFFNRQRLHSTLGYLSPFEFGARLMSAADISGKAKRKYKTTTNSKHQLLWSAKRRRLPYNAVVESFFATLKTEEFEDAGYETRQQAKTRIFGYLEGFYNAKRRHSSLGYLSPNDFERLHFAKAA